MNTTTFRILATALTLCVAGAAAADKITTLKSLKKGAAIPAGQAALLIVLDQGTQGSAVKRPKPVTMELVAVDGGARYRITDSAQADVVVAPPMSIIRARRLLKSVTSETAIAIKRASSIPGSTCTSRPTSLRTWSMNWSEFRDSRTAEVAVVIIGSAPLCSAIFLNRRSVVMARSIVFFES